MIKPEPATVEYASSPGEVNTAWMWGALLATSIAGRLHQLTATSPTTGGELLGWGVRAGKAMIATLRHRLIRIPTRLIHHAGTLIPRLPTSHHLLTEVLTRLHTLPTTPGTRTPEPKIILSC